MGKVDCRLPSINTLLLDYPLPLLHSLVADFSHRYTSFYTPPAPKLLPPVLVAHHAPQVKLPLPLYYRPLAAGPAQSQPEYSATQPEYTVQPDYTFAGTSARVPPPGLLPVAPAPGPAAPVAAQLPLSSAPEFHVVTALPAPTGHLSPSPARHSPGPSVSPVLSTVSGSASTATTPIQATTPKSVSATYAVAELSRSPEVGTEPSADSRRRKKRQCPECRLYFSNLATHKSTHLNPTARPHVCKICQRGFARPNDLFRHFKCHWKEMGTDSGQFKCPFKNGASGDHCSHTLGIFSRCDTYKNHLKAIHFQYPGGTRKSQRNLMPGRCRLCQLQFANVDDWLTNHIDTHQCAYTSSE